MKHLCVKCHDSVVPQARRQLGYLTCMSCGETAASKVRHTIAPLNKGNYMLFTDMELLKQLNPKRTS
jgi:transcription elongation factor Elf1